MIDKQSARDAIDALENIEALALQVKEILGALPRVSRIRKHIPNVDGRSKIKLLLLVKLLSEVEELLDAAPRIVNECRTALNICIMRQDAVEEQERLEQLRLARQRKR